MVERNMPQRGHWTVLNSHGSAKSFHQKPIPSNPEQQVWIHTVDRPAIVFGSTQKTLAQSLLETQDRNSEQNTEFCYRHSGGGIVNIDPRWDCWIDLIVPTNSPLWNNDIGHSFLWLGNLWAETLKQLFPLAEVTVSEKPSRQRTTPLLCFAATGMGEVSVDGYKTVGLSQRRQRDAVRFQCLYDAHWDSAIIDPVLKQLAKNNHLELNETNQIKAGLPHYYQRLAPKEITDRFITNLKRLH